MTEAQMDQHILENAERDYLTPVIVLSNGLRVANFSSNHSFKFIDGSILPAVSNEICKDLSIMDAKEEIVHNPYLDSKGVCTIKLSFNMSNKVRKALSSWVVESLKYKVDVVIVPLPVMTMLHELMKDEDDADAVILDNPFRTIRVVDRTDPEKKIYIDKFCI